MAAEQGTPENWRPMRFRPSLLKDNIFYRMSKIFNRMSKIQKLAVFHIEDPKENCQVLLALMALKYEQRGEDNDKINCNRH